MQIMKNKQIDGTKIWKQLEDMLVPRLRLTVTEHAVYSHLVRHSRLEGKLRAQFSISRIARHIRLSTGPARDAVRKLVEHGALRLVQRSKAGYVVEVHLPEEIRAARPDSIEANGAERAPRADNIEEMDFMQNRVLRQTIHARDGARCFYCLRHVTPAVKCLDHVVPRTELGRNSYRNLVSCCLECNTNKGERQAEDFLRWLYREHRLSTADLADRLRALEELAAGKLRPGFAAA
jgi:5-methylcytosine-specific restriction endonuclease McrA